MLTRLVSVVAGVAVVVAGLAFASPSYAEEEEINSVGYVSWENPIYAPVDNGCGTYRFVFSNDSDSAREFTLTNSLGAALVAFSIPPLNRGTYRRVRAKICDAQLVDGLGPYTATVTFSGADSTPRTAPLMFRARPDMSPPAQCYSDSAHGGVSAEDAIEIASFADLECLRASSDDWDKHVRLVADISGGGAVWKDHAIGTKEIPFSGTFDGSGHTISDLNIRFTKKSTDRGTRAGLFGVVDTLTDEATISGVTFTGDVSGSHVVGGLVGYAGLALISDVAVSGAVKGSGERVGGLVGDAEYSSIHDSVASGKVKGRGHVGGLLGYGLGVDIEDSVASGRVIGNRSDQKKVGIMVGGLVGYQEYGAIIRSSATGKVTGYELVGGLTGCTEEGEIVDSFATGDASGSWYVGGLVGEVIMWAETGYGSYIQGSYASGNATATNGEVGGLVGNADILEIENSYATGDVSGMYFIGGLIGAAGNVEIDHAYSTGRVQAQKKKAVGGLIGRLPRVFKEYVVASYWNTQTSKQKKSAGGQGKSTAWMTSLSKYQAKGWDIAAGWSSGDDAPVWGICPKANSGYPFLNATHAVNPCVR